MEKINYIIGNENTLVKMSDVRAWKPFDERAVNFCGTLSEALLKESNCQLYPDLITLAFWLRKKNIQKLAHKYLDMTKHLGRGLVFHIAPGNMALSFAYSLATGLSKVQLKSCRHQNFL